MKTITYTYDVGSEAECRQMKAYLLNPAQGAYDEADYFTLKPNEIGRIKARGLIHESTNSTPRTIITLLGIRL